MSVALHICTYCIKYMNNSGIEMPTRQHWYWKKCGFQTLGVSKPTSNLCHTQLILGTTLIALTIVVGFHDYLGPPLSGTIGCCMDMSADLPLGLVLIPSHTHLYTYHSPIYRTNINLHPPRYL